MFYEKISIAFPFIHYSNGHNHPAGFASAKWRITTMPGIETINSFGSQFGLSVAVDNMRFLIGDPGIFYGKGMAFFGKIK